MFVSPSKARRLARKHRAELLTVQAAASAAAAKAATFETALTAVAETTSAVKVPNGTTKKIGRIVGEALASV